MNSSNRGVQIGPASLLELEGTLGSLRLTREKRWIRRNWNNIQKRGKIATLQAYMVLLQATKQVVQKPSFQFKKLTKLASASYRSRIVRPSHAAHYLRKERTAGSLSIDKIGDEKNE